MREKRPEKETHVKKREHTGTRANCGSVFQFPLPPPPHRSPRALLMKRLKEKKKKDYPSYNLSCCSIKILLYHVLRASSFKAKIELH